jgi:hypothetical protein
MGAGGYASPSRAKRSRRASNVARATVLLAAMLASSCAALHKIGLWSAPGIGSFHGVGFGDGFRDTELRYPAAVVETSPYGARSLRLDDIDNDGIIYQTIIYEFAYKAGMQLVMAEFDASRTRAVHGWIVEQVGAPMRSGGPRAEASGISIWTTLDRKTVILNADSHWLAIIGPKGERLRPDIKLRELNARSSS